LLKIEKDLNLEIFMLKIFLKKLLNQERTLNSGEDSNSPNSHQTTALKSDSLLWLNNMKLKTNKNEFEN
jgi:hypothetical protein